MLESDGFKRRAALRAFNETPEVRVFLLSLRHGAAGLTLVSEWVGRLSTRVHKQCTGSAAI